MEDQISPFPRPVAQAALRGDVFHPQIVGEVLFSPYGQGTLVVVRALGLPPSQFLGLHIHENGVCDPGGDTAFSSAGGHYNPQSLPHPSHAGDLPPLLTSAGGVAMEAVYTDRFRPADVIGRAVVVHGMPDDLHTQPAGDSGARIACGVVEAV